jgi:hypothetical protein
MNAHGRRQLVLFLVALMLPSAAIAALGWRIVVQDREIAEGRLADDLSRTKDEVYRAVLARLHQIKLQQISQISSVTPNAAPAAPRDPAVVLTGIVSGDQLLFSWDLDPGADRFPPRRGGP